MLNSITKWLEYSIAISTCVICALALASGIITGAVYAFISENIASILVGTLTITFGLCVCVVATVVFVVIYGNSIEPLIRDRKTNLMQLINCIITITLIVAIIIGTVFVCQCLVNREITSRENTQINCTMTIVSQEQCELCAHCGNNGYPEYANKIHFKISSFDEEFNVSYTCNLATPCGVSMPTGKCYFRDTCPVPASYVKFKPIVAPWFVAFYVVVPILWITVVALMFGIDYCTCNYIEYYNYNREQKRNKQRIESPIQTPPLSVVTECHKLPKYTEFPSAQVRKESDCPPPYNSFAPKN